MRSAGILLPVFSLPGNYGIGCFSREAYRFVDYLKNAGQSYWQILPIGPTGYGDSPYQSFSTMAGNPYFIDLEDLISQGLLTREECDACDFGEDPSRVDYGKLYQERRSILKKAFLRADTDSRDDYQAFLERNSDWLDDYALFMALKEKHGGAGLNEWEKEYRYRDPYALDDAREEWKEEIDFQKYLQFEFERQWSLLRTYAQSQGISLIGDIPIYVSMDSADFWAHPELFQLDENGDPSAVAGCPPDGFSADGQLWGNPLYRWEYHAQTGFAWWIRRIAKCMELFDVLRIDHFRGFDQYFSIPAGAKDARGGQWKNGPGKALFDTIHEKLGEVRIIAEDLGYITDSVRRLVRQTGFPNMKVLEFAFDSRDSTGRFEYLPYTYEKNCVVYTGTHDNETLRGWLDDILPSERRMVRDYIGLTDDDPDRIIDGMLRMAHSSVADTCIIPLQDYLHLDNQARINQPSTTGSNWKWRVTPAQLTDDLSFRIRTFTATYGR